MRYLLIVFFSICTLVYGFSLCNHNVSKGKLVDTKEMPKPAEYDFNFYGNQALADSGIAAILSESFLNSLSPEIICNLKI